MFVFIIASTAEVLDKIEFPWETQQYIRMLVVFVCAAVLATSARPQARIAGLIIAISWATLSVWVDPWFTPDIGNALRAELTAPQRAKWLQTIFVQAFAPLAITLIVFLWRLLRATPRPQSPR